MQKTLSKAARGRAVMVWDAPTRLFHWLLVALIVVSWITGDSGGDALRYHFWSGYAILTLVLFRIAWGFVGGAHARFASFVRGWAGARAHLRALRRPGPSDELGHNAIGGWMIVAMLAVLLVQTTTGLFADDDIVTTGPLGDLVSGATRSRLTTIHKYNFELIEILAAIHIAAVLAYLVIKRDNLIGAMITGRKRIAAGAGDRALDAARAHPALAAAVLAGAAAAVAGIVGLLPYLAR